MNNRKELLEAINLEIPQRIPYTYEARTEADKLFKDYLNIGEEESVENYFECNTFSSLWPLLGQSFKLPERMARNKNEDKNVNIDIWGF